MRLLVVCGILLLVASPGLVVGQDEPGDGGQSPPAWADVFRNVSYSYLDFSIASADGTQRVILIGNVHLVTDDFELFADELGGVRWPEKVDQPYQLFARGHVLVRRGGETLRGETFLFSSETRRAV